MAAIFLGAAGLLTAALVVCLGPLPPDLSGGKSVSTIITDRSGVVLFELRSGTGTRSEWLAPDAIPPRVAEATIAAEDRRFFQHSGIDPVALGRALLHDLRALRLVEGGSTLSQQVAKLLTGSRPRTLGSKLSETVLALRLEHHLTKRQILALYLNLAPYGNQTNGIVRASHAYFGCEPRKLTIAQATFLAALPRRPGRFNPYRDQRLALTASKQLIRRMAADGSIRSEDARLALAEQIRLSPRGADARADHFVQRLISELPEPHPVRVVTTLDAKLQKEVEGIIDAARPSLRQHGATSVAVVVLDNRHGEWLAWEGSGDYFDALHGGAIDGVTTPRQPGSTLKPFTYALAFERGRTPATVLADVPSNFETMQEGIAYSPRNYDGIFRGPLRARFALGGSENVPAVALLSQIGVPDYLRFLRSAGFTTFDKTADFYGLGVTLGDAEVRLDELVTAYSAFARGGVSVYPRSVRRLTWQDGRSLSPPERRGSRLVNETTAFWITDILSDPHAREYIFGTGGSLDFPFAVAAKTGTSQSYHDNWTVGLTRDVTVGVWVGNFDRTPLRNSSGVTGAAPIFHQVMLAAEETARGALPPESETIVEAPPDLEQRKVCAVSGLAPNASCPTVESEWIPRGTTLRTCDWHSFLNGDSTTNWPAEYRPWASEHRARFQKPPIRQARRDDSSFRISNPPAGAIYLIDPTLRSDFQMLSLKAVGGASETVRWIVDGKYVGSGRVAWRLARGTHRIEASTSRGARAGTEIYVK